MATVTTTKAINLSQLAGETSWALSCSDDGTTRVVTCWTTGVTNAALQAAVDNHVAIDEDGNRRTVADRLALDHTALTNTKTALDTIIAKTNNQIGPADTKDVAREVRTMSNILGRLIREALDDFDGTD